MAAYWMVRSSAVRDEDALKEYGAMWPSIAERFGAKVIARGPHTTPEGPEYPRALIVEFPDIESAEACYRDPAYQDAIAVMQRACDRELIILDGI